MKTLRVPLGRVSNPNGDRLNQGCEYVDVPVVIDSTLDVLGMTKRVPNNSSIDFTIILREWNEQVLLHELLHIMLDHRVPASVGDPYRHDVISAVEVGLWETGWRLPGSCAQ